MQTPRCVTPPWLPPCAAVAVTAALASAPAGSARGRRRAEGRRNRRKSAAEPRKSAAAPRRRRIRRLTRARATGCRGPAGNGRQRQRAPSQRSWQAWGRGAWHQRCRGSCAPASRRRRCTASWGLRRSGRSTRHSKLLRLSHRERSPCICCSGRFTHRLPGKDRHRQCH